MQVTISYVKFTGIVGDTPKQDTSWQLGRHKYGTRVNTVKQTSVDRRQFKRFSYDST